LLLIGLVSFFVPAGTILNNEVENLTYLHNPLPGVFTGCFMLLTPNTWIPYIFPFIFETIVFVVTVRRTRKLISEFGPMPLTKQLLKDGSLFYAAILLTVLATCIGARIPSMELAAVASGSYAAFSSIMCNRLICSLYTFEGSTTVSTITGNTLGAFELGIPMSTLQTSSRSAGLGAEQELSER
ncbi:hypothetical protein FRC12_018299, partial [Ceratobasidium sp. 428]